MVTLQSRISLIQSQIHQPVINFQHRMKKNLWIKDINSERSITSQGALADLNHHLNSRGEPKVNISLFRKKIYQRTDIEDICSRFDQVIPVVSHLEFCIPKKPPTPKNIGEGLTGPQRQ